MPAVKKEVTLEDHFEAVARTKSGQVVLKAILSICQFKMVESSVDPNTLISFEAKRAVWGRLRHLIPASILNKIEAEGDE